jgi:signal transduction histidine kinase
MTDILGDTIRKMDVIVRRFKEERQHIIVKLRVDVNHILMELLRNLPSRLTKGVTLQTHFSEIPQIWGDPYYLHNAFHSIVENAIDAMPNGGILRVTTRLIQRRNRPRIVVEISDTGVGMTPSFLESKLFSPFVSTKDQGLGLGLFTSQQIFALHQGTIEAESTPGEGSTFRITLPADANGPKEDHNR